jgi:hypothetical protein
MGKPLKKNDRSFLIVAKAGGRPQQGFRAVAASFLGRRI